MESSLGPDDPTSPDGSMLDQGYSGGTEMIQLQISSNC